jgi:hypothetical protein
MGEGIPECDQRRKRWIVLDVPEVLQRSSDRGVDCDLAVSSYEAGSDLVKECEVTGRRQPTHRPPGRATPVSGSRSAAPRASNKMALRLGLYWTPVSDEG